MTLPLSSLSIFPANAAQIYESRKRSFVQWGRGATLEEYLRRDARTDQHEVSRDSRLITWVLARRGSPGLLDFLCSCETYRRDGLVVTRERDNNNTPQAVTCYGVASVFTPVENRKKGYARHMVRLLHWVLASEAFLPPSKFPAEWGSPLDRVSHVGDAAFSVLYSDVGADFYLRCGTLVDSNDGWFVTNPMSTTWDVAETQDLLPSSVLGKTELPWTWLDAPLAYKMWEADARVIKEEMSTPSTDKRVEFTFLPHKGVAEFQQHRLQYYWEKMNPRPIFWGVCAAAGGDDSSLNTSTFATWTLDVRPPETNDLIITRIRVRPEDFLELLNQIVGFAKRHGVETVEVWNLPFDLQDLAHTVGGKTFARDEHLSSFRWYGKEGSGDVAWIHNEKFCWC